MPDIVSGGVKIFILFVFFSKIISNMVLAMLALKEQLKSRAKLFMIKFEGR